MLSKQYITNFVVCYLSQIALFGNFSFLILQVFCLYIMVPNYVLCLCECVFLKLFLFSFFFLLFIFFASLLKRAWSWVGGEDLEADGRGETVIRIYCRKKIIIFN